MLPASGVGGSDGGEEIELVAVQKNTNFEVLRYLNNAEDSIPALSFVAFEKALCSLCA